MATVFYLTDDDAVEEPAFSTLQRKPVGFTFKGTDFAGFKSLETSQDSGVEIVSTSFDAGAAPQASRIGVWVTHPLYAGTLPTSTDMTLSFRGTRRSNPNWATFFGVAIYFARPATGAIVAVLADAGCGGFPQPTGCDAYIGNNSLNGTSAEFIDNSVGSSEPSWLDGDVLVIEVYAMTVGNTGALFGQDEFRYGNNDNFPSSGGDAAYLYFPDFDFTLDPPKAIGEAGGIASAESVGTPSVSGALTVDGIESAEAFGIPSINQPAPPFDPTPTRGPAILAGEIGQRQESVLWRVTDLAGTPRGVLAVDRGQAVEITNDISRPVRRQAGTLVLPSRPLHDRDEQRIYAGEIDNWYRYEVRPSWVLSTGDEYPLGVFRRASLRTQVLSQGDIETIELWDRMKLLHRPMVDAYYIDAGQILTDALVFLSGLLGLTDVYIDASSAAAKEPLVWPRTTATYLDVYETVCAVLGYLPPYFNNNGALICRGAPDFENTLPDHYYGENLRVVKDSIFVTHNDLNLPNRYEVTSTSSTDVPLFGYYEIPEAAPHSYANNGGLWYVRQEDQQGLETDDQCAEAARALYAGDIDQAIVRDFDALPDPRHDTHSLISFDGVLEREVRWSLRCAPAGPHHHETRRVAF